MERDDEPDRHGISPVPEPVSTSIMTRPPASPGRISRSSPDTPAASVKSSCLRQVSRESAVPRNPRPRAIQLFAARNRQLAEYLVKWPVSALLRRWQACRRRTGIHPEPTLGVGTKRQISSTSGVHFSTDASPVAARMARGGRRAILPRCPRENGWRTGKCLTPTDISGRVSNRCLSDCVLSPYFPPGGRLSIQKGDDRRDAPQRATCADSGPSLDC
jgi:hypothetical protein